MRNTLSSRHEWERLLQRDLVSALASATEINHPPSDIDAILACLRVLSVMAPSPAATDVLLRAARDLRAAA